MLPLHAISNERCLAPPGLKVIDLIDPQDLNFPIWHTWPGFEALSFKPGKSAYRIEHQLITGQYREPQQGTEQGDVFTGTLSFRIRTVREAVEYLRTKLAGRYVHAVITYQNGAVRFVPWLLLRSEGSSGGDNTANGYAFSATNRRSKPAPWVDSPYTTIIQVPVEPPPAPETEPGSVTVVPITTTGGSTHSYTVPAGKLVTAIYVRSASAQEVSVGTTPGGSELGGPVPGLGGQNIIFGSNIYYAETSTVIHFSGLVGINSIRIYLL